MTQDEVIAMAREAGARTEHWATKLFPPAQFLMTPAELERFAALVAAAEREACAQECDKLAAGALADQSGSSDELTNVMLRLVAQLVYAESAAAIRSRSTP